MEPLKDPVGDRKVKSQPPPPHKPLDESILFPEGARGNIIHLILGKVDWKVLKEHLYREGVLSKKTFLLLIKRTQDILSKPKNLICRK